MALCTSYENTLIRKITWGPESASLPANVAASHSGFFLCGVLHMQCIITLIVIQWYINTRSIPKQEVALILISYYLFLMTNQYAHSTTGTLQVVERHCPGMEHILSYSLLFYDFGFA
jgi:hypothetical protein